MSPLSPGYDRFVSEYMDHTIAFNMPIKTHSSVHTRAIKYSKAMFNNSSIIFGAGSTDFGFLRGIDVGSHLTGRYAMRHRAATLGLHFQR